MVTTEEQIQLIAKLLKYSTETLINWYCVFLNQQWADDFIIAAPRDWWSICNSGKANDHYQYSMILNTFENFFMLSRHYLIQEEHKQTEEGKLWASINGNENEAEIKEFCEKLDAIRAS